MKQRQYSKAMAPGLLPMGVAAVLAACGGGDGAEPVLVGKSVASYDISGVVESQKQALSAAGAKVAAAKCYPGLTYRAEMITEDRTPAVLYVYEVRARDVEVASGLGFSAEYSTAGFSQVERACVTDPDTPANDTEPDDIPAEPS